jgi:hypothetical protein
MHLTLLPHDFEIVETIPLAKGRHVGPREKCVREECSQAHESIHIKWTDSHIKWVLVDIRGAATSSFCDGSDSYLTKEQYAMVKYVGLNFIIYWLCFYHFQCTIKYVQVSIAWLKHRPEAYQTLCKLWASEEFITKSIKARECRGIDGPPGHTYGPDGHVHTGQRMLRKIVTKMHSHFVFSY